MDCKIPAGALETLRVLTAAGYEANLVGGCVRDLLRGESPNDWDICTSARPEETKGCFPGRRLIETGIRHGTVAVRMEDGLYEVTTYRVDGPYSDGRRPDSVRFVPSLTEDLARRDFTINAMALDVGGGVCDPFGGRADLQAERIRCVGDPDRRFQEDGLRVMRALRFAAALGFAIEPDTAAAVHRNRDRLRPVAAERIREEFCKLLPGAAAGAILRAYPDVIRVFWPELDFQNWDGIVRAIELAPPALTARLVLLLHGAPQAGELLRRLRFDNAACATALALLDHMDAGMDPSLPAVRRLLNELGAEKMALLLTVLQAEAAAGSRKNFATVLDETKRSVDGILARGDCFTLQDLAVSGRDLLGAGVSPGPQVGRTLNALLEQVMDGTLPNEREMLLRAARCSRPKSKSDG